MSYRLLKSGETIIHTDDCYIYDYKNRGQDNEWSACSTNLQQKQWEGQDSWWSDTPWGGYKYNPLKHGYHRRVNDLPTS